MTVFLTIFVVFCLLYAITPQKYIKWLFLAATIALSVMAFHCVPKETDDLSRYYPQINILRNGGWNTFQTMLKDNDNNWGSLPVCGYYFYFISLLNSNGYLPGITIFLAYGAIFYVLYKASVRFKVNKWYLFLACAFFMTTYWFYDICSGIRNGLAFTLFAALVYQDVVEKKYRPLCYIGYALCIGLHSSTIVFAVIRIALEITKRHGSKLASWVMIFSASIGGNVLLWIGEHTDNTYLQLLSEKAEKNVDRSIGWDAPTNIIVNVVVSIVIAIFSVYLFRYIRASKMNAEFDVFGKFYTILMFFTFGCFDSGLIFIRMVRWILPFAGSTIFMLGMQACRDKQNQVRSTQSVNSVIKNRDGVLAANELIITLLFIAFTGVHLWYTCTGSSLIWLHFK